MQHVGNSMIPSYNNMLSGYTVSSNMVVPENSVLAPDFKGMQHHSGSAYNSLEFLNTLDEVKFPSSQSIENLQLYSNSNNGFSWNGSLEYAWPSMQNLQAAQVYIYYTMLFYPLKYILNLCYFM